MHHPFVQVASNHNVCRLHTRCRRHRIRLQALRWKTVLGYTSSSSVAKSSRRAREPIERPKLTKKRKRNSSLGVRKISKRKRKSLSLNPHHSQLNWNEILFIRPPHIWNELQITPWMCRFILQKVVKIITQIIFEILGVNYNFLPALNSRKNDLFPTYDQKLIFL